MKLEKAAAQLEALGHVHARAGGGALGERQPLGFAAAEQLLEDVAEAQGVTPARWGSATLRIAAKQAS